VVSALSRFRSDKGCEDAVRDDVAGWTRLFENISGFLGLDVLCDTEDVRIVYLVTRWTDWESFRQWHAGAGHEALTALQADPSFTPARSLAIPDSGGAPGFAPAVAEFLRRSANIFWLKMDPDGMIVASNPAIAKMVTGTADSLDGILLWTLLTEPDAAALRRVVAGGSGDAEQRHLLNFVSREQTLFTAEFNLCVRPDGFALIGEAVRHYELALQGELMALNNQSAVLLRENERKTKVLRHENASIDAALKNLQESHWHIKKLQEVLRICMRCGKVQTGESTWEEIVRYLERNSLLMSHGYCPTCLVKEIDTLRR
jgi:heme-degrading monooxygenase HmoA